MLELLVYLMFFPIIIAFKMIGMDRKRNFGNL